MKISQSPTPEEAAAILAALETINAEESKEPSGNLKRSRWRMAGILGHTPPDRMKPGDSLWSYSRWEGMV